MSAAVFLFFSWVTVVFAAGPAFFDIEAFGNFKQMIHSGDTAGKVSLSRFRNAQGVYGLGALAGLHGEIWIWDGKVAVSRSDSATGATEPANDNDQAALLVTARVKAWKEISVKSDLGSEQFEKYVLQQAETYGIDVKEPFPFLVRGSIRDYQWHVVTGASAGHGEKQNRVFKGAFTDAVLLGFYSASVLEGIISHPGQRFHVHYANPATSISGHLDAYRVAQPSILLLPVR